MASVVKEQESQTRLLGGSIVFASDLLAICCSSYAADFAYHTLIAQSPSSLGRAFAYGLGVGLIYILLTCADDLRLRSLINVSTKRVVSKFAVSLSIFLSILFLLKIGDVFSRGHFLLFAAGGLLTLLANRQLFAVALRTGIAKVAFKPHRLALIGDACEIKRARHEVSLEPSQFCVVETLEVCSNSNPVSAVLNRAIKLSREESIDAILIAMPWSKTAELENILAHLRQQALPVMLLPDLQTSLYISQPAVALSDLPAYVIKRAALSPSEQNVKRVIDIIVTVLALVALWPIFVLVACAIKLESRGPVFFRQRRCGFNNREFSILKFRTMHTCEDGDAVRQVVRNDPRLTKIGAFLRRTSIDELPQLLNVLRGEMSIVGPRPHAMAHDKAWVQIVEFYALRHHIKPGITGLAQVNGCRGETDTASKISDRVRYDLQYIDRWSLWLDFQILLKTLLVFAFQKSAY